MQRIGAGLIVAFDDEQYYCYNSTNMILSKDKNFDLKYILALLNSDLFNAYYRIMFGIKAGLTVNVTQGYLSQLPIKKIFHNEQKSIIDIVDEILQIKKRILILKDSDEKLNLKDKLNRLETKLNELVYKIYSITNIERKIVEESLK